MGNSNNNLHITVSTTPQYEGNVNLTHELQILKTALLYADKVTFCSIVASHLKQRIENAHAIITPDLVWTATVKAFESVLSVEKIEQLHEPGIKNRIAREQNVDINGMLQEICGLFHTEAAQEAEAAGLGQLHKPTQLGILEVKQLYGTGEELIFDYFKEVTRSIWSGHTFPIFDLTTAQVINQAIGDGARMPSAELNERAKQVALSSELLARLPRLDEVPMDEIVDIRTELQQPLTRFRAAVIGYSREIKSLPWEPDFHLEAERVFFEAIEPAVLELEELCRANQFLNLLLPAISAKPVDPAGGTAFGVILAHFTDLSTLVAGALGAVGGISLAMYEAYRTNSTQINGNNLYFYFRARKTLSGQ